MKEQIEIFNKIKELITEVIGQDFIEEYDLNMESTLTGDLEMESIEIVQLSIKIIGFYGKQINLEDWMTKMTLEELVNLSIKDIVNFLEECMQLN
jgi:acyl carrier protein